MPVSEKYSAPRPTWRRRWPWAVIVSLGLAGFAIALFAPDDVLESAVLRGYVSLMSPLINPKGLMGTRSAFSQVTLLYHAVAIWSLPAWLVVVWRWMNSRVGVDRTGILFKLRLSLGNRIALLILLPLWLGLAYGLFSLNHGGDARLFAFGSSRIQLATLGMATYAASAALISLAAFSIKRLFNISGNGDRQWL